MLIICETKGGANQEKSIKKAHHKDDFKRHSPSPDVQAWWAQQTKGPWSPNARDIHHTIDTTARWGNSTPLGRPVDPDVNKTTAMSADDRAGDP
jgi:hypothetical protein